MDFSATTERTIAALATVAAIWQTRLDEDRFPASGSAFPWTQVRLSLSALLPGMRNVHEWVARSMRSSPGGVVTVILAGNTPLLAWSPLCAALLSGAEQIRVKMSRDETVWTPLFLESLWEADPELARRITLYDFPGADERTDALLQDTDAVIAYGSDTSIAALQARTPPGVPFFGYGHAVSVGLFEASESDNTVWEGFATDVLMYNQQGCLSPHILYGSGAHADLQFATARLAQGFAAVTNQQKIAVVSDSTAASHIREARDLALFAGHLVEGDELLRWTVIASRAPLPYPPPVGHCVVYVSPFESNEHLADLLRPVRGIVSCAGYSGERNPGWKTVLQGAGVSRTCRPGEMQTPPLGWQNGNRDLLAELSCALGSRSKDR